MAALVALPVVFALLTGCSREQQLGPRTGDEPPIRVRGGSIELKLLTNVLGFEEVTPNDKKNWKIATEPDRGREEFEVFIRVRDSANCPGGNYAESARRVEFVFGSETQDFQKIEIKAGNRRTRIKADQDLKRNPSNPNDQRFLTYAADGQFIKRINIDNENGFCTFSTEAETRRLRVVLVNP
jgi:hypothetical protein